jgi:hypothetical protein
LQKWLDIGYKAVSVFLTEKENVMSRDKTLASTLVAPVGGGVNYVNLSASALVKTGEGNLCGIFVASASSTPTIKVWDNTSAATTVLVNTFTPLPGTWYPIPMHFLTGCYVTISGTVDCTVSYS